MIIGREKEQRELLSLLDKQDHNAIRKIQMLPLFAVSNLFSTL